MQKLLPDAVVMDISMPNLSGIEATRHLRRSHPGIRVVMLSQYDFPHMLQQALNAGASAYVVKSHANTELAPALRGKIASGRMPVYGSARKDTDVQTILRRSAELEEALRESEERFTLAQHAAQIGTFDLNLKTNLTKWTRKMEQMWGFAPGEFTGRQADWEARLHPDDHDELMRGLEQVSHRLA